LTVTIAALQHLLLHSTVVYCYCAFQDECRGVQFESKVKIARKKVKIWVNMMPSWCCRSDSSTASPSYSVARRNGASFIQIGVELSKKCALKDRKNLVRSIRPHISGFKCMACLWSIGHAPMSIRKDCSEADCCGSTNSASCLPQIFTFLLAIVTIDSHCTPRHSS
jgi:hypothetical protein